MMYGYNGPSNAVKNTVFVNHRIINRSSRSYSDFRVGTFNGFDLGNSQDDFIGSDSTLQLNYVYNGDSFDEDNGGASGFKDNPPAFGVTYLNQSVNSMMYFQFGNGALGNPSNDQEHYDLLNATWKDGSHLVYGENGHQSAVQPPYASTNFMYSGDPVTGTGWTEFNVGHTPGDKRTVSATTGHSLQPGEEFVLDVAYVLSDTNGDNLQNISSLKANVAAIRQFYDNQNYPSFASGCTLTSIEEEVTSTASDEVSVFPNPSKGIFNISSQAPFVSLTVYSLDGRKIMELHEEGQQSTVDLSNQSKGIYFIHTTIGSRTSVHKVVLQ